MNNIFSPANLSPLGERLSSSGGGGVFGGCGRGGSDTGVQVCGGKPSTGPSLECGRFCKGRG